MANPVCGRWGQGPSWYEWAAIPLLSWQMQRQRSLLPRSGLRNGKLAYYVCYTPRGTPLNTLVRVAGMRWTVEECFEAVKGEVSLDQYNVCSWHGWYRHMTLAMFARVFQAALCAQQRQQTDLASLPFKDEPNAGIAGMLAQLTQGHSPA